MPQAGQRGKFGETAESQPTVDPVHPAPRSRHDGSGAHFKINGSLEHAPARISQDLSADLFQGGDMTPLACLRVRMEALCSLQLNLTAVSMPRCLPHIRTGTGETLGHFFVRETCVRNQVDPKGVNNSGRSDHKSWNAVVHFC